MRNFETALAVPLQIEINCSGSGNRFRTNWQKIKIRFSYRTVETALAVPLHQNLKLITEFETALADPLHRNLKLIIPE